jgi:hypothetical protein
MSAKRENASTKGGGEGIVGSEEAGEVIGEMTVRIPRRAQPLCSPAPKVRACCSSSETPSAKPSTLTKTISLGVMRTLAQGPRATRAAS